MTQQEKFQNSMGQLSGLKQAIVILEHIASGLSEDQIVQLADGDAQMVRMWISFLNDIGWLREQDGKMRLTSDGMVGIAKYGKHGQYEQNESIQSSHAMLSVESTTREAK